MVYAVVVAVVVLSVLHVLVGLISICVGVASSIQALVWLAHTVSPIWSGAFFILTGGLGFASAKRKTSYMIMCFSAFSIVSLVTCVVSIQLLRMGLVNHHTDGNMYQKEEKDKLIIVALGCAGAEILTCLISSLVSCRMAQAAKKELFQSRAGCFHVQEEPRSGRTGGGEVGDEADAGVEPQQQQPCPIWGANQHSHRIVPVDGRYATSLGYGHANPALISDAEADWLDLGIHADVTDNWPPANNNEPVDGQRPQLAPSTEVPSLGKVRRNKHSANGMEVQVELEAKHANPS